MISIPQGDVPAFREMLVSTELVEIVKEQSTTSKEGPLVLFTLDAGLGNAINYYYLGQAHAALLRQKGGQADE
ncbi:hypothetical protein [Hymenobacter pini]|uniref:hypothetical protein n=1 Tax=Hymenobacter pini TaxID=2880879 RepID=UPI001CF172DB|nr:hypothetical protein [Hymenobacter pini]MCA8830557.1 hypothetical protein [Hymenobacter pini]